MRRRPSPFLRRGIVTLLLGFVALSALAASAGAQVCDPLVLNEIVCENQLVGNPSSEWDISGAGDFNVQGYAAELSIDQGETARFKIKTDSDDYRVDIYRLGWYGGMGARLVATVQPLGVSPGNPQLQPACEFDGATRCLDCGDWAISAEWTVPATAVSGIYLAKVVREDATPGACHIVFVVRDDDGGSALLVQTGDATWQAYNMWNEGGPGSGNSLYGGPGGKATKVSYNRPFGTRGVNPEDYVFNADYPLVRWLERNGYDVSYTTNLDVDRLPAELLEHGVFVSVGHDEYWSRGQREAVRAARDAGVHLAFFSGNEVYWKTRWEPSIDGASTPHRTLVCYKEGTLGELASGGKTDPLANVWTGLWRDGCAFTPPADGCEPENSLSGQISWVGSTGAIQVPGTYAALPFWRSTSIAALGPLDVATLSAGTLGYEWDPENATYAGSYPPGRVKLSTTNNSGLTHHMSLYRHASGALVFGAGTVQWAWGLDANHDRSGGEPDDIRVQQATVNLFADMSVEPLTLQPGLVNTIASADLTLPASGVTAPLAGAHVNLGGVVTITGTASDTPPGVVALVEVSTDGGLTWHAATGTTSWSYDWTPSALGAATIQSRATDGGLNTENPGPGVSVIVDPQVCPCSLWSIATVPGTVDAGDVSAIEVGVKFRSDLAGFITAIRFYKSSANVGPHTVRLWDPSAAPGSQLLASFQATVAAGVGWREVALPSAVAILPTHTYIASYHTPQGHYSFNASYFATSGHDNGILHALQDGIVDGPNGVYAYGAVLATTPPTSTYSSSNYWVDPVFVETVGPDETPPVIVTTFPTNGATNTNVGASVTIGFNESLDPLTVTAANVELRDAGSVLVPASLSYASAVITLDPSAPLDYSTTYTVTVQGDAGGVADLAGNELVGDQVWSFTTQPVPPPPPDEGPGGPILVVAHSGDPFGRYYAEILRNEGFNAFDVTDISLVTPVVLAAHRVALLASMSLSGAQATMLSDWVTAGGNLIAMRPDAQLAGLLGITPAGPALSDRYLLRSGHAAAVGIVNQTMQFHGAADLYTLNGAAEVATLYSDATTATPNPAVTLHTAGSGRAAAFAYDLARSVVYTRQGNPAWAGQERDGVSPIRSDDLFYGNAIGDPQPDWVDLGKVAIPQADEQQRLLANLILHMSQDEMPLPRFWYFPRGLKAVVIMTGDDHGAGGTVGRFNNYLATDLDLPSDCSAQELANWECVRGSSYIYPGTPVTQADATLFHSKGFEIGLHVDTGCGNWTAATLDAMYTSQLASLAAQQPTIPGPSSNRTHCIAWSEWSSQADVAVAHGIRLDANYYFWPPAWVANAPGVFTGSGMPMRFARLDGSMIDCFQAATQMTDESGQTYPFTIDALLDRALGAEGYYGAFTANMHTDGAAHAGSDAIVASARARGVPVVSGRQMLEWLDARNGSSFENLVWVPGLLTFDIASSAGLHKLEALLPYNASVGTLNALRRGGSPIAYTLETTKGVQYARFEALGGSYEAEYTVDTSPPQITAVSATPGASGTAVVAWTTDEVADSRVDYGTDPGMLTSNVASATHETSHSLMLSGLTPSTLYYYRVTSADPFANFATEPNPPAAPNSFTSADPTCVADATEADFSAGTASGTWVANGAGGEVMLLPERAAEFTVMPPATEWQNFPWAGGGTSVISSGSLVIDGSRFNSQPQVPGLLAGRVLEFRATFTGGPFQHIGFGAGSDIIEGGGIFNHVPWAMFSTQGGGEVTARTHDGATDQAEPLPGLNGAPHTYRIEWEGDEVRYYVDGTHRHTRTVSIAGPMRPALSDIAVGGPVVTVDWVRCTPFSASGEFASRVFDAGAPASWGVATWDADIPANTSLAIEARQGGTPVPDETWTPYVAIASSGTMVGGNSRYIQYRANLATTDVDVTPQLRDLQIACMAGSDLDPPVISNVMIAPGPSGTTATIQWDTDELATSKVYNGTSPATLDQIFESVSLTTSHSIEVTDLTPGTGYYCRLESVDGASNSALHPTPPIPPLAYATPLAPPDVCALDATAADFRLGDTPLVYVTDDGQVVLRPTEGSEFDALGPTLPLGWTGTTWQPSGSAIVTGGRLEVIGARAGTDAVYHPSPATPRYTVEFDANIPGGVNQHVGLGVTFNELGWAIFSTRTGDGSLWARSSSALPGELNTLVPGSFFGANHRYRIEWEEGETRFYVDGNLVATHAITITESLRPIASEFINAATIRVENMRLTPYQPTPSPVRFTSRVFDAGSPKMWGDVLVTSDTPAGTSLATLTRTGNTPAPDGTWTAFAPVAGSIGQTSRYMQYACDLQTTDVTVTPSLSMFRAECSSDVTPPDPPVLVSTTPSSPSNVVTPTVNGTAEAGATVRLYTSGDCSGSPVGTGAVDGLGNFAIVVNLSGEGAYTFRATAIDGSGNASSCSASLGYFLDMTPPAAPVLVVTSPTSPSSNSNPSLIGTAEAGATCDVYEGTDCTGSLVATGLADGLGDFSIAVAVAADGAHTFTVRAQDAAGNVSTCSNSLGYTRDTVAPAAPVVVATNPVSPSSNTAPLLLGTAEAGTTCDVYESADCSGPVVATGAADGSGNFSIALAVAGEGTHTFTVRARDLAGNSSTCSNSLGYTLDTTPPAAPVLVATSPASPSSNANPSLLGTAEASSALDVYESADCSGPILATGAADGGGNFSIAVVLTGDGTRSLTVRARDLAGNSSTCSNSLAYTLDTTPPAAPVLVATSPASPSSNANPSLLGTAEASSALDVYESADCSGPVVATGAADGLGDFSIAVAVAGDGVHTFTVRARDLAGNSSTCSNSLGYTLDTTPPATPVLTATVPASPSNSVVTPLVEGSSDAGTTVRIFTAPDCTGTPVATVLAVSGSFSVGVTVAANSTTTFYASATDQAGNPSMCSAGLTYVHDDTPPAAPVLTASTPASPSNSSTTPALHGTAEDGSTVRLHLTSDCSDAPTGSALSVGGSFSIGASVAPNSSTVFYASAVDVAGNVSTCSAGFTYVHDDIAPAVPVVTGTSPASPGNDATPTVDGTAEPDVGIVVYATADCTGPELATSAADGGGAFAVEVTLGGDGLHTFSVRARDLAGNESTCSNSVDYILDTVPPGVPVITSITPSSPTNATIFPIIQGTADPGTTVRLHVAGDCSGPAVASGPADGLGNFSIQATVTPNSTTTFFAAAVDDADNASGCSLGQSFTHLSGSLELAVNSLTLTPTCVGGSDEFDVDVHITSIVPDPAFVQGAQLDFTHDAAQLDLLSITVPPGSIWGGPGTYTAFPDIDPGTGRLSLTSLQLGGVQAGSGGLVCRLRYRRVVGMTGVLRYSIPLATFRSPVNVPLAVGLAGGSGRANRILGDFTNDLLVGGATSCGVPDFGPGDGDDDVFDLAVFSNHFGANSPAPEYCCLTDIGPTSTGYIFGEPLLDGLTDFEDLIIFGISYGFSSSGGYAAPQPRALTDVVTRVGLRALAGGLEYELEIEPAAAVQGVHAILDYDADALRIVSVEKAGMAAGDASFLGVVPGSALDLSVVALGTAQAWSGSGAVARIRFERIGEGGSVSIRSADLRDSWNRSLPVQVDGASVPVGPRPVVVNYFSAVEPNPVRSLVSGATFRFGSAIDQNVELVVYDATGRQVRVVVSGRVEAGDHTIAWDGRDDGGTRLGSGVYFVRFTLADFRLTRKFLVIP
jgi:hypothetical protein